MLCQAYRRRVVCQALEIQRKISPSFGEGLVGNPQFCSPVVGNAMGQLSSFSLPTGAVKIALISLASVAQLVGVPSPNTPEGCRFNPQSGHIPRLWVQSPAGARSGGNQSMFLSCITVSLSPPHPHQYHLPLPAKAMKKCPQVKIKK